MTELERARAHLRHVQTWLRLARIADRDTFHFEDAFLAALSWAWEEQEKRRVFGEQVAGLIGCPTMAPPPPAQAASPLSPQPPQPPPDPRMAAYQQAMAQWQQAAQKVLNTLNELDRLRALNTEMLDILKRIVSGNDGPGEFGRALEMARNIIARAEGRL